MTNQTEPNLKRTSLKFSTRIGPGAINRTTTVHYAKREASSSAPSYVPLHTTLNSDDLALLESIIKDVETMSQRIKELYVQDRSLDAPRPMWLADLMHHTGIVRAEIFGVWTTFFFLCSSLSMYLKSCVLFFPTRSPASSFYPFRGEPICTTESWRAPLW